LKNFVIFKVLLRDCSTRKLLPCKLIEGEYQKLNSFFQSIGISHLVSYPHAHQQNGSAEHKHWHIVEVGLTLLAQSSMPLKFWDEAFFTAVYLINRTPSKVIGYETPLERLFKTKPNYLSMRVFGCACWPNLRPYNQHKLQFRSKQCVFLGNSTQHKGFKCLDITEGRVYISRDVVFDETIYPFAKLHPNAGARLRNEITLLLSSDHAGVCLTDDAALIDFSNLRGEDGERNSGQNSEESRENRSLQHHSMQGAVHMETETETDLSQGSALDQVHESVQWMAEGQHPPLIVLPAGDSAAPDVSAPTHTKHTSVAAPESAQDVSSTNANGVADQRQITTRSQHGISKPKVYTDGTIRYNFYVSICEPASLQEALGDENWRKAMDSEFEALWNSDTWCLVPPRKGINVIDCMWVYKIKRKPNDTIDRYKARLVAKGFK
jgi:hypothetical protein